MILIRHWFDLWTDHQRKQCIHNILDCLWIPKCVKLGWFVPYTPADNEYGSWKKNYRDCAADLDYVTPREAAEVYGTKPKGITEEMKDRQSEL
ncbi:epithelial cell-transforming sequence 2 oncogene-like isoform X1 [Acipenser oxyrinchus oxyrinchus]|uniref:Epithelial cell-transforming sequence 2 oncogene-like isoform X1 n=1 Tax=Acipenser oxyrinchus oxyrinchus TaxID=40147 RepID=A0AAD8GC70_ACIOX|nr:epithelial cell-transforming sequence 2 oncogene-like isoform X1 [Acipenser oxyrinchus oxyrinchus]